MFDFKIFKWELSMACRGGFLLMVVSTSFPLAACGETTFSYRQDPIVLDQPNGFDQTINEELVAEKEAPPIEEIRSKDSEVQDQSSPENQNQPQNQTPKDERIISKTHYKAKARAYYPDDSPIEGGFKDRRGNPLFTLQQFLKGKAPYVAVSMDPRAFPYGTHIMIPELEKHYGQPIVFRVVDTGGAFFGKGTSRIDICVQSKSDLYHPLINGIITLVPVKDQERP